MPRRTWWLLALWTAWCMPGVGGHGRMLVPPSRPTAWRLGFNSPVNYNDNEQNCGGRKVHRQNGYKCGVCGDPWQPTPRPYDRPDGALVMKEGFILSTYHSGKVITASIQITAAHLGYFEFFLCNVDELYPLVEATEECLQRHPLVLVSAGGSTHYTNVTKGVHNISLQLPPGLVCRHCVLQWIYTSGNDWNDGCRGCGHQELFLSCADLSITHSDGSLPPSPATSTTTPIITSSTSIITPISIPTSTTSITTPTLFTTTTTITTTTTTRHPFHYVPEALRSSLSPDTTDHDPPTKEMLRFFLCSYCVDQLLERGRWPPICLGRLGSFRACPRRLN